VSKVLPRQHGLIIIVNDGNIPWDVDFRGNSSIVAGGWLIESSISGGEVGYFFLQFMVVTTELRRFVAPSRHYHQRLVDSGGWQGVQCSQSD